MSYLIIGNAFAFFGSIVMIGIGFIKNKNKILLAQCLQCALLGVGNLILGGITGFITNVITVIRNLVSCKVEFNTAWKLFFIVIQIIPALAINKMGTIGMLPIVSACIFTWFMDTKNEIFFKVIIIITMVMWIVYDFSLKNYVAFSFDLLTTFSNSITLYKMTKEI